MNLFKPASQSLKSECKVTGNGFVLLEVLVSLTVLAVGVMAVLISVLTVLDLQKDSALRYRAGLVLQDKLGAMVFTPYNGQPIRGMSDDGRFSWAVVGEPWAGAPHMQDNEEPEDENIFVNLYRVSVDVSWQTSKGNRSINASQLVQIIPPAGGIN